MMSIPTILMKRRLQKWAMHNSEGGQRPDHLQRHRFDRPWYRLQMLTSK